MTHDDALQSIHRLFDTPALFLRWLKAKEDADVVGVTTDGNSCPLATFARDKGLDVFVGEGAFEISGKYEDGQRWYEDPDEPMWVEEFIREIDLLALERPMPYDGSPVGSSIPVTASAARDKVQRLRARGVIHD